jgi:hypothetical protein
MLVYFISVLPCCLLNLSRPESDEETKQNAYNFSSEWQEEILFVLIKGKCLCLMWFVTLSAKKKTHTRTVLRDVLRLITMILIQTSISTLM